MKRNMYLILFISAVLLVFVRSKMSVNAAESTFDSSTGEYFYTWTESGSSYDVDGNITGSRNDTFTISGDCQESDGAAKRRTAAAGGRRFV